MLARSVISIAASEYHSLALKSDGTVVVWGDNWHNSYDIPEGLSDVIAIEAGNHQCFALKSDGTIVAWGWEANPAISEMPEGLSENDKELFKKGFRARIKSSHSTTIPRKEARFLRSFGCIVLTIFFIVIPIQNSGKGL